MYSYFFEINFFLVFYLYLPIEVAQRGKMAGGGGTHLLLVWPGFGFAELASHVHVGWVCCWFMCLLWGFFSGASGFPPSTKPTFQIPIQPASSGKEEPPSGMSIAEFPFIYLFILFNRDKKDGDQNLTKTNFWFNSSINEFYKSQLRDLSTNNI